MSAEDLGADDPTPEAVDAPEDAAVLDVTDVADDDAADRSADDGEDGRADDALEDTTDEADGETGPCPSGMVFVPAGPFVMGSDPYEGLADEEPEHIVTVSAFCIDRREATNAEYRSCEYAGACSPRVADCGPDHHPVLWVDWDRANAYCAWKHGRLPTEAEWEKAARGGCELVPPETCGDEDERRFPWGEEDADCRRANSFSCVGGAAPVGVHPEGASPYGVEDLAGNAFEWVQDVYGREYYATCVDGCTDPTGPDLPSSTHAARGGSWATAAGRIRVSARARADYIAYLGYLGVRCVRLPLAAD